MQALPVDDASVDAVVCQFGLMFVPDKPLALREMRRVLRAGGTLLLSTWDHLARNPASQILHELAIQAFPDDPPTFMATPFSMPDPDELRSLASAAGFREVAVETVAETAHAESAAHLATGFVRGNPLWNQLSERGVDAAAFEATVSAALARLRRGTVPQLPVGPRANGHRLTPDLACRAAVPRLRSRAA